MFVTVLVIAIIFVAGLVLDGGNILAAQRQAGNEAESAARAGAQHLDVDALRSTNEHRLDEGAATAAVNDFVSNELGSGHHVVGTPSFTCDTVTVTIEIDQRLLILGIAGLIPRPVSATATARIERGVASADPSTC
ncbi:MAG: Tad domain-containing protein [Acidimicrobiales bacterium]